MPMPDLTILAQVAPLRLITGEESAPVRSVLPLWIGLAIVLLSILVTVAAWLITVRSAHIGANAAEYAFRALARRQRVSASRQRLLRRLAACAHTSPVALLISDHALVAAMLCFERTNPGTRDLTAIKQLSAI